MLNISGFLEKFKKLDGDKTLLKEKVTKDIEKVLGISLPNLNFTIRDGVLFIQGSPALKQEIFLKKQQLLNLLVSDKISDIK